MGPKAGDDDILHIFEAVERVGRAYEEAMRTRSHLHLAACGGCGGPTFKQPCPHCGFYPMGDAEAQRAATTPLTAEAFEANVRRSAPGGAGNLATWYVSSYARSSAYVPHSSFRNRIDGLLADVATMGGLPEPAEVFRVVTTEGRVVGREVAGPDEAALWRAVDEVRSAFDREDGETERTMGRSVPSPGGLRYKGVVAITHAVSAIHGDVDAWDDAIDGLGGVMDELSRLGAEGGPGARWAAAGNLRWARSALDEVRERRAASAPAP